MKVLGVFINIVLFVTLAGGRGPAHGLMRVIGNDGNLYKRPQRIFGGEEVKSIEAFPYMAFMTYWVTKENGARLGISGCGATILTPKYLLTAAHCVVTCKPNWKDKSIYCKKNSKNINTYQIYVGSVVGNSALQVAKVKAFHVHPENKIMDSVNRCFNNYDIAIVELRRLLQFNSKICNVQLPLSIRKANMNYGLDSRNINTNNCKIVGWGLTRIDEPRPNTTDKMLERHLKVARANLIDNQQCLHHLRIVRPRWGKITINNTLCLSTHICTKDPQNILGVCNGDSGGPIVCDGVQIAVTSFANNRSCVGPNIVQIYSRVDTSMEWIRTIVTEEEEYFYGYVLSGCRRKL